MLNFIYIFHLHPCHPEPHEGSVYTRFFSTELHSNRLKIKLSAANEEVTQVFCQPLKTGFQEILAFIFSFPKIIL